MHTETYRSITSIEKGVARIRTVVPVEYRILRLVSVQKILREAISVARLKEDL